MFTNPMSSEIPTGLFLLRMIRKEGLNQKVPGMKYKKFVFSSVVRIINGYLFLANIILVLVGATAVLGSEYFLTSYMIPANFSY